MAKHKKSMLEAFNTAGGLTPLKPKEPLVPSPKPAPAQHKPGEVIPVARQAVPVAPAAPIAPGPSAGGPFVESSAAAPRANQAPAQALAADDAPTTEARVDHADGLKAPSSALVWVLLALIVTSFSAAAWFGKQDASTEFDQASSDAAGQASDGQNASEAARLGGFAARDGLDPARNLPRTTLPALGAAPSESGALDPLMDPANKFTVVVITFGKSQSDLAAASIDFVRDAGLPANRLLRVKNKLVVCVGASPTKDGLIGLEGRIQQLSLNGEKRVYSDAFIDSIDKYIDR